jgi:hypothetical protein
LLGIIPFEKLLKQIEGRTDLSGPAQFPPICGDIGNYPLDLGATSFPRLS